jgi:hypothetical protein
MKLPNWQHHSKKEQKRSLKPQAMRQAKARRQALKKKLVAASALMVGFGSPAMAHTYHHHHEHHYKPRPYVTTSYNYRTCTKTVTTHFFFAGQWSERVDYQRIKGCRKHHYHHDYSTRRFDPPVLPAFPERKRDRQPDRQPDRAQNTDDNSCIEGSILGGIAGGGLGAALSRGDGRWWAVPTGIVGGALVGCQVDGG